MENPFARKTVYRLHPDINAGLRKLGAREMNLKELKRIELTGEFPEYLAEPIAVTPTAEPDQIISSPLETLTSSNRQTLERLEIALNQLQIAGLSNSIAYFDIQTLSKEIASGVKSGDEVDLAGTELLVKYGNVLQTEEAKIDDKKHNRKPFRVSFSNVLALFQSRRNA